MQKLGIFATIEGISGVGKTFFSQQVRVTYPDLSIQSVTEIIDRQNVTNDSMDSRIIALLHESSDRFFQNNYPLTTTFLLFALTMHDTEAKIYPSLADGKMLIKDRYIDTLAVYQALLLCPDSFEQQIKKANELYEIAACWCPIPDITFLIEDDFETAIHRAQVRNGDHYRDDELAILRGAARLYDAYARDHASRIIRINRQDMTNEEILHCLHSHLVHYQKGEGK